MTRVDEEIPGSLFGDDLRLRQSLSNLLSAAINATKEGAVTLSIEERERNDEEAVVNLNFRIAYTGGAIPEGDLRVSLAKAFVDLMGGRVSFSKEEEISLIIFEIKQGHDRGCEEYRNAGGDRKGSSLCDESRRRDPGKSFR